jgi:hypothetical protein
MAPSATQVTAMTAGRVAPKAPDRAAGGARMDPTPSIGAPRLHPGRLIRSTTGVAMVTLVSGRYLERPMHPT